MDLFAYAQMDRFTELMDAQCIDIPRLRGVRWMKEEEAVPEEEIRQSIKDQHSWVMAQAVTSEPRFALNPLWHEYSAWTDYLKRYYLIQETEQRSYFDFQTGETQTYDHTHVVGARWDRIHGKNRKNLKYMLKKSAKEVRRQYAVYNKYAGREDVLQVHARIGGANWTGYDAHLTVEKQPWFLERVDDAFDHTYCDIYVKIDGNAMSEVESDD